MNFCPGCGKRIKGKFCSECAPASDVKIKDILIKICSSCMKYFYKNKWTKIENLNETTRKIVSESVKTSSKITRVNPHIPHIKFNPGIKSEFISDVEIEDNLFQIPGKIEITYCDNCSKKQGRYFEGTLQLRNISPEISRFIDSYMKKHNLHTSKKKDISGGMDIDISDQKKVQGLGNELQKKFGGILKISPRIFSRDKQTSRDIYRVNVYYEAPHYEKNSIVKIGNKLVLISSIGKEIKGIDLRTGKKVSMNVSNAKYEVLHAHKTTVSKIHPHLEVLHPETFQSVRVENHSHVKPGEKVEVVEDNGSLYIL